MLKESTKVSEMITVEFSEDMPLKLNVELDKAKLEYFLAPNIDR